MTNRDDAFRGGYNTPPRFPVRIACIAALATGCAGASEPDAVALQQAIETHIAGKGPVMEMPEPTMTELDGAEPAEAVVFYCIDHNMPGGGNAGASNPANVACWVTAFGVNGGQWALLGEQDLGHGEVSQIAEGVIHAESLTYVPEDPLCCPSQKRAVRLAVRDGRLTVLP